jgi:hypothetical protein
MEMNVHRISLAGWSIGLIIAGAAFQALQLLIKRIKNHNRKNAP